MGTYFTEINVGFVMWGIDWDVSFVVICEIRFRDLFLTFYVKSSSI